MGIIAMINILDMIVEHKNTHYIQRILYGRNSLLIYDEFPSHKLPTIFKCLECNTVRKLCFFGSVQVRYRILEVSSYLIDL